MRSVSSRSSTTPERGVPRVRAPRCGLHARDVAALLVDRDHEVVSLRAQVIREQAQLLAAFDVPGIEHDTAKPLDDSMPDPVRHDRALEAGKHTARGEALELAHQALTAPAVRPKAIFRWTRRKKITTGMAVSVDAAMSPPQSVARLVP